MLLLIILLHQSIFKRKLHHSRSINGDTEESTQIDSSKAVAEASLDNLQMISKGR